jgi:1-acyl-sn-glycerol-3-phosphate acyltransferase
MTAVLRGTLFALVRLLVGAHARWQGCAPLPRQRVYFANHSSHLDTLVIMAALPGRLRPSVHPVAALDYWGRNRWRRFLAVRCLRAILVDRSLRPGSDPLQPLVAELERGHSLVIFPEGTRGDGTLAPFKGGLFHLARRFPRAELVPVQLENLHRVMPKGTALLVPLICTARFGAPLRLEPGESKAHFLERARAAVATLAEPSRVAVA